MKLQGLGWGRVEPVGRGPRCRRIFWAWMVAWLPWATAGVSSAGCYLPLYWPMHDGDRRMTRGPLGDCELTWSGSGGSFLMESVCDGTSGSYRVEGDELQLTRLAMGWTRLYPEPAIVELTDSQLRNGGSRRVNSSVTFQGVRVSLVCDIKVSNAGTVVVPAGRFENCKSVSSKITGSIPGEGSMTVSSQNYVLAPGAGIIRVAVYDDDFRQVGWQDVVSGWVGGVPISELAGRSSQVPPNLTSLPGARSAPLGGSASFTVGATGGGLEYQWYHEGVALVDGEGVRGARTATLTLQPVAIGHAGAYRVTVANRACSTSSPPVALTVQIPGSIHFGQAEVSVLESISTLRVPVRRTQGNFGRVTVRYETVPGTALASSDYTTKSGTLTWSNGDSGDKTIEVRITNDRVFEVEEGFQVRLSAPTGGALLGDPVVCGITIRDDDPGKHGAVQFAQGELRISEGAGVHLFSVRRVNGTDGPVSVSYVATGGTAEVGRDFLPAEGVIAWGHGESAERTVALEVIDDGAYEGLEGLQFSLRDPVGGVVLGSPSVMAVLIEDNDPLPDLRLSVGAEEGTGQLALWIHGEWGAVVAVESSLDLREWREVAVVTLDRNPTLATGVLPPSVSPAFFRARRR